jgi:hypothetical protein
MVLTVGGDAGLDLDDHHAGAERADRLLEVDVAGGSMDDPAGSPCSASAMSSVVTEPKRAAVLGLACAGW